MGVLDKLIKKRDAAYAVYQKWQTLIDTLESDPDFAGVFHGRAVNAMNGARARLTTDAAGADALLVQAPGKKTTDRRRSRAYRNMAAERMRALWRDPKMRQRLLRAVKKGGQTAAANKKKKDAAARKRAKGRTGAHAEPTT